MKALVIGSGMMGSAMAYDLAQSPGVEKVFLADIDLERARKSAAAIGAKVEPFRLDINEGADVVRLMKMADVCAGATSYTHNVALTEAAITSKVHFCDLGGNMDVVDKQLAMNKQAADAGVLILPNCGLAPGMACVIAAGGAKRFSTMERIHVRVGG